MTMDLRSDIQAQIDQYLQHPSPPCRIHVAASQGELSAELTEVGRLGCELWAIELIASSSNSVPADLYQRAAEKMAARVRYLIEPLQVHEVDSEQGVAQVRSHPPKRDHDAIRYFEATVARAGTIELRRYEKLPNASRRQIAATVTIEVLHQLATDLLELLNEPSSGRSA